MAEAATAAEAGAVTEAAMKVVTEAATDHDPWWKRQEAPCGQCSPGWKWK